MAISYDTATSAYSYNTSNNTTANVAAAEANEIAIIFVQSGGENHFTSMTVGGVSATQIGSFISADNRYYYAFYFLNPPTSSTAYTFNAGAFNANFDVTMVVALYKGAKQTGQPDATATAGPTSGSSQTLSATVTAANSWLVSFSRLGAASTGTTARTSLGGHEMIIGDSNGAVAAGSRSMAWTSSIGTINMIGRIVSIAPSVASGPANLKTWNGLATASVKTINSLAIGSVKSVEGLT